MSLLHPDRLFPADPEVRGIARRIFSQICDLPILSPHGHTDPGWFAEDAPFPDPTALFLLPDHYILRMLYSQGVSLEDLEIGVATLKDPRRAGVAGMTSGAGAMVATAMRVLNAVPYVVAAEPGLLSSVDLPLTIPRNAFVTQ